MELEGEAKELKEWLLGAKPVQVRKGYWIAMLGDKILCQGKPGRFAYPVKRKGITFIKKAMADTSGKYYWRARKYPMI